MRVHARIGKLSVPTHVDYGRGGAAAIRVRLAAAALGAALALLSLFGPAPVRAANGLTDPGVSPGSGTTATLFELSVTYTGPPPTLPARVWAVIPGGTEVDLDTTDPAAPATYRASRTLPAGDLTITFLASPVGSNQPTAEARVTVTPEPGPTAPATPTPLPSATPPPGSPAPSTPPPSAAPSGSALPTVAPTPLPPGVTPVPAPPGPPAPPAPPGASPGAPTSSAPPDAPPSSPASSSQALSSPGSSGSLRAGATPDSSGPPDIAEASDASGPRGGLGQVTLVALGSATSVAGAAILMRQWRARRAVRSAPGAGTRGPGPMRRYPPRR